MSPASPFRCSPALALLAITFAAAAGCRCDGGRECEAVPLNQPDHPGACGSGQSACGERFSCTEIEGGPSCCLLTARTCASDAECCPGQACHPDQKVCGDRYVPCERDADCDGAAGESCQAWSFAGQTSKRCQLTACDANGGCADGRSCFAGLCVADLPCDGACPDGKACVAATGRCQSASCPTTCAEGFLATYSDGRNLWDSCSLAAARCECIELPPLHSNDTARFTSLSTAADGKTWVSSYDGDYGDLVVRTVTGEGPSTPEYVDGVPAAGPVRFGPSGPRGGKTDAGPDVGRYSDVATGGGRVYVSYRDVSNGDLKLATRTAAGAWTVLRVDGADSDTGYFSSVAVDANGNPGVAYFQRGGSATFNLAACPAPVPTGPRERVTALRFARANKPEPTSSADFTVVTIACHVRPAAPCEGCGGICADTGSGSGPQCLPAASGCTGCDAFAEACVLDGTPKCGARFSSPDLLGVPDGVGLFPSLAFNGNQAVIAFGRREGGTSKLYGATVSAANAAAAPVLLDGSGDTGHWPSLAIASGGSQWMIAYHDAGTGSLELWQGASFGSGATSTVDTGQDAPGDKRIVGVAPSLAIHPSTGAAVIAYQDATKVRLKVAQRSGAGGWSVSTAEGVGGFFPHPFFSGALTRVLHSEVRAANAAGEPRLESKLVVAPAP